MEKEKWLDDMRAIACIMVAFGHLINGSGEIFNLNVPLFLFLTNLLYRVHVPVFFFCSGYLFQKGQHRKQKCGYIQYTLNKIINLGVPYIVFCSITYVIKIIFPSLINRDLDAGFIGSLLIIPPNQMWFLFVLMVCFIITPIGIKNKKHMIILSILAVVMNISYSLIGDVDTVGWKILSYYIWFVIGMIVEYGGIERLHINHEYLFGVAFLLFFYVQYTFNSLGVFSIFITAFGIAWILMICRNRLKNIKSRLLECISKYMFQIYLLHTFFAAAIRVGLRILGISSGYIHLMVGLVGCIGLSVISAYICEKLVYPNIVFYPIKTIKQIKEKWRK